MKSVCVLSGFLAFVCVSTMSYADCDSSYNYCKASCDRYYEQCKANNNSEDYCTHQYSGDGQCLQGCSNALDTCNNKTMKP